MLDRNVPEMRVENHKESVATAAPLALMVLAIALGGCSTSSLNLFGSSTPATDAPIPGASANANIGLDDVDCPVITVRTGASTLTVTNKAGASGDSAALDLRYQGSIVRTARECQVRTGTMTMKVGIEGRIILGPAGGSGQFEVPLRLAVVQEGPSPRTVMSKLVRIPVTVSADIGRATFTHIDPEVSFPLPKVLGDLDSYVVYVGFDPNAAPDKPKPTAKPRRKH